MRRAMKPQNSSSSPPFEPRIRSKRILASKKKAKTTKKTNACGETGQPVQLGLKGNPNESRREVVCGALFSHLPLALKARARKTRAEIQVPR